MLQLTPTPTLRDKDLDGYEYTVDCNDYNPAINPGAYDAPCDGLEMNCDLVDGTAATSVLVSSTGADGASCGTRLSPCREIQYGITRAASLSRTVVLVTGGSFARFRVTSGISVYGGFGLTNWMCGAAADSTAAQSRRRGRARHASTARRTKSPSWSTKGPGAAPSTPDRATDHNGLGGTQHGW